MEVQTASLSQSGRRPFSTVRMTPDAQFVSSGRLNAEGEPVLYAATDVNTAILESRCPLGSAVTVSEVKKAEDQPLKIADLREFEFVRPVDASDRFRASTLSELTKLFSSRLVGDSGQEAYKVTQLLGKYFCLFKKICGLILVLADCQERDIERFQSF